MKMTYLLGAAALALFATACADTTENTESAAYPIEAPVEASQPDTVTSVGDAVLEAPAEVPAAEAEQEAPSIEAAPEEETSL